MNVRERVQVIFNWLYQLLIDDIRQAKKLLSWLRSVRETLSRHGQTKLICLIIFLGPFVIYFLEGWTKLQDQQALVVGIVAVGVALGGLVLNAGLNLKGQKREEFIRVAQQFIAVVIIVILLIPIWYFVELMYDTHTNAVQPSSLATWVREGLVLVVVALFFGVIFVFISALVDLAFAMGGIGNDKYAGGKCRYDGCSNSDAS